MDSVLVRDYCAKKNINAVSTVAIDTSGTIAPGILIMGIRSNITAVTVDGVPAENKGNQVWYLPNPTIAASIDVVVTNGSGGWGGQYLLGIFVYSYGNGFAGVSHAEGWGGSGEKRIASCPSQVGGLSAGIVTSGDYATPRGFLSGASTNQFLELGDDGRLNYAIDTLNNVSVNLVEDYYCTHIPAGFPIIPDPSNYISLTCASVFHGTAILEIANEPFNDIKKVAGVAIASVGKVAGVT